MSFDGLFAYNAGNILPSTLKWYIASVLEIVSLWHKLFISPPPPFQHRYFILDDCVQCPQFLETPYFWNTFYILFVSPLGPWADHERVLFFLITDAIFFYDGSSQSNSDSGSSTSTFLGATLDLCSVLGQNGFSSGTARLLPLCNSNRIINFYQLLYESEWFWCLSFFLRLFIFLILSARFNVAISDPTLSANSAIPVVSSDAILNCLLSCLCTPGYSLSYCCLCN